SAFLYQALKKEVVRLLTTPQNVAVLITEYYNPMNQHSVFFSIPTFANCQDSNGQPSTKFNCYARTEQGADSLNQTLQAVVQDLNRPNVFVLFRGIRHDSHAHDPTQPVCGSPPPATTDTWIQYPGDPNSNGPNPQHSLPGLPGSSYPFGDCFHP